MRSTIIKLLLGLTIIVFKIVKGPGIAGFVRCTSADCTAHNIVSGLFLGLGIWLVLSGLLGIRRAHQPSPASTTPPA